MATASARFVRRAGPTVALLSALLGAALWSSVQQSQHDASLASGVHPYLKRVFADDLETAATYTHFAAMAGLLSNLEGEEAEPPALQAHETLALLDALARPLVAAEVPAASVVRTRLLIEKSVPDQRGAWLGSLLEDYVCYLRRRDALQRQLAAVESSLALSLEQQRQQYAHEVAVRETCLGQDVSRLLFAEQDRLMERLLQRGETLLRHSPAGTVLSADETTEPRGHGYGH